MTKSSDLKSAFMSGQTSRPYSNIGKRLTLMRWRINSLEAILSIFPIMELAAR